MSFASCAQDLDSREDTSADPILAAKPTLPRQVWSAHASRALRRTFPYTRSSQKRGTAKFAEKVKFELHLDGVHRRRVGRNNGAGWPFTRVLGRGEEHGEAPGL